MCSGHTCPKAGAPTSVALSNSLCSSWPRRSRENSLKSVSPDGSRRSGEMTLKGVSAASVTSTWSALQHPFSSATDAFNKRTPVTIS